MYELQTEVMSRAGELRGEGLDASEALSQAWDEFRGEDNPGEYLALLENNPVSKATGLPAILVIAGIGLVIYRLVKKEWPWQSLGRRELQRRVIASKNNPGDFNKMMGYNIIPAVIEDNIPKIFDSQETTGLISPRGPYKRTGE